MLVKNSIILLLILGFIPGFIACSEDEPEWEFEDGLETRKLILNELAHDTLVRYDNRYLSGVQFVWSFEQKDTIYYEAMQEEGAIQGEWFNLKWGDGNMSISTQENQECSERSLVISIVTKGKSDGIKVIQKGISLD